MPAEEYSKAYKLGKKAYRAAQLRNEAPYLPSLERILDKKTIISQEELGVVDIPLELVAGTYYSGRQPTFGRDFLPLMPEKSEFAQKWISLCRAHMDEGIRDTIKACEYKGRFYVIEGHKRVSVLKYFGAWSISGHVTRVLTAPEDTEEDRIYREFLKFYKATKINFVWFSREGGYAALLKASGTKENEKWDDYERMDFRSFYAKFSQAFEEKATPQIKLTPGDALLVYLGIYDYTSSVNKTLPEIRFEVSGIWDEIKNRSTGDQIKLVLKPVEAKNLFAPLAPRADGLRVAFIHSGTEDTSGWTYNHEIGRRDLEAAFKGRIETICLDKADSGEAAAEAIRAAVVDRSDLIFTTSPLLLSASVKAALANPKIHILNCSLNTTHPSVRTYHARLYEAKFLMGMIAGALSKNDILGYVADYPIYGSTANINAFALGAKMVNPRARVRLEWSKTVTGDGRQRLIDAGIEYISDREMISPDDSIRYKVGLYRCDGDSLSHIALSACRWGRMYTKIVSGYLSRGWKSETKAVNYWWGMESGVTDLICSRSLPDGTARLIELMSDSIRRGAFQLFSGKLISQDGSVHDFTQRSVTPEELITMGWLLENVDGGIPETDKLTEDGKALVKLQGIYQAGG